MRTIAFIPARAGSKRLPGKNMKMFFGHPLIEYAIQSAFDAELFDDIYISSNIPGMVGIANNFYVTLIRRPDEYANDTSPDKEWIDHAISVIPEFDCFAILRPTNPFRTGATIRRAWGEWDRVSMIKAVEPVKQHPGKMWHLIENNQMIPYHPYLLHLQPTQNLLSYWIQNASLELWPRTMPPEWQYQPFLTQGYEGFDINTMEDFILAEALVEKDLALLPIIRS